MPKITIEPAVNDYVYIFTPGGLDVWFVAEGPPVPGVVHLQQHNGLRSRTARRIELVPVYDEYNSRTFAFWALYEDNKLPDHASKGCAPFPPKKPKKVYPCQLAATA